MWLWGHINYHVTLKVILTFGSMASLMYILSLSFDLSIHNSVNSCPRHFKFPTIVVEKRNFWFRMYYVISIFTLEYLHYVQSNWDQTGFGKSKMTVTFISIKKNSVTSGLADMTSWKFQLQISFLFYVGLSNKLVKEIWVVHMTLRLYKISCDIEGHIDLWGLLKVNAYSFFIVWFVNS